MHAHIAAGFALATILPGAVCAQGLTLSGPTGSAVTFDARAIKAMPHRTVTSAIHGLSGTYAGVPLTLLLARVDAPRGETLRGPAMNDIVTVKGCDGYRIVLTLPDIDPAFRNQTAILADTIDGHALIVEGDKRAARSVRCVTSVAVSVVP
jgi:hypothetical protein